VGFVYILAGALEQWKVWKRQSVKSFVIFTREST